MKLAFDAKRLFLNNTGLGNYSRTLVSELSKTAPEHELLLFTPKTNQNPRATDFEKPPYALVKMPDSWPSLAQSYWRSQRLGHVIKGYSPDLYHGLSNELPADIQKSGIPSIVTVHDLIFLRFPQYYPFIDRSFYERKTKRSCRDANVVVAISQRTADDLVELLGVDSAKIEVIYQGCDASFRPGISEVEKQAVTEKLGLEHPFVLSVGTIEDRKNQLTLVQAFCEGDFRAEYELVLVGKQKAYAQQIHAYLKEKPQCAKRVRFFDHVDFKDLPPLLSAAACMVYPSRYEGFGLPVLEAQKCEVPVIAASGSCLEETGGEAALYFEPDSSDQLKSLMSRVLQDEGLRKEITQKGSIQSAKFSNEQMVKNYLNLYQRIAQ